MLEAAELDPRLLAEATRDTWPEGSIPWLLARALLDALERTCHCEDNS